MYGAIHRIRIYPVDSVTKMYCTIHQIQINPVDSVTKVCGCACVCVCVCARIVFVIAVVVLLVANLVLPQDWFFFFLLLLLFSSSFFLLPKNWFFLFFFSLFFPIFFFSGWAYKVVDSSLRSNILGDQAFPHQFFSINFIDLYWDNSQSWVQLEHFTHNCFKGRQVYPSD